MYRSPVLPVFVFRVITLGCSGKVSKVSKYQRPSVVFFGVGVGVGRGLFGNLLVIHIRLSDQAISMVLI